jgi:SAM-dependent methyltransferase
MKAESINEQTKSTNAKRLQHLDIRLNLGCGKDLREGYINSDLLGGDVQCDLRKFPWPWPDNYADEILMWNVLEHMPDTEATVMEVRRILKPGGLFHGRVPFCYSQMAFAHQQHFHYFHVRLFEQMASDLGFELVQAELAVDNVTMTHKLRNLIPFRKFLGQLLLNMWDAVDFKLCKPADCA